MFLINFVLVGQQEDWPADDQPLLWQGHWQAKGRGHCVIWWPTFRQSCHWLVWWYEHGHSQRYWACPAFSLSLMSSMFSFPCRQRVQRKTHQGIFCHPQSWVHTERWKRGQRRCVLMLAAKSHLLKAEMWCFLNNAVLRFEVIRYVSLHQVIEVVVVVVVDLTST